MMGRSAMVHAVVLALALFGFGLLHAASGQRISRPRVFNDNHIPDTNTLVAGCSDNHHKCPQWAIEGECYHNKGYMYLHCRETCGLCSVFDRDCSDTNIMCPGWADIGECTRNKDFMTERCPRSCGHCVPAKYHDIPYVHSKIASRKWAEFEERSRQRPSVRRRGGNSNNNNFIFNNARRSFF